VKRLGAVDLTNGKVMLSILRFSWPIFVGNAFQQLYNVVDTAVLGRYADYCAMASVGLCFPIIVSVIALFCGIGTGTSVIVSRYRGAGENNSIKETILSAWGIVLVGSIPLALLGVWNAEVLLQLAGVHEALIGDAASYLRIYFSASIAVLGYGINDGIPCSKYTPRALQVQWLSLRRPHQAAFLQQAGYPTPHLSDKRATGKAAKPCCRPVLLKYRR
jgi:Na+-driven multidrug efflux pump